MKTSFVFSLAFVLLAASPEQGRRAVQPVRLGVQPLPEGTRALQDAVSSNEQPPQEGTRSLQDAVSSRNQLTHSALAGGSRLASRSPGSRIVGGRNAKWGQFPWQAALILDGEAFCGGSVLSDTWILTAGHCVDGVSQWTIFMGSIYLESGVIKTSSEAKLHPNFDLDNIENDIAVVKLPSAITFKVNLQPTVLPARARENETYVGKKARVTGWGKTSDTSLLPRVLKYVDLKVISNQECAATFGEYVRPYTVCTSGRSRKGSCSGDSGGPLIVYLNESSFEQIGIVSYGAESCRARLPSAYTRIASFLDWISNTTGVAT